MRVEREVAISNLQQREPPMETDQTSPAEKSLENFEKNEEERLETTDFVEDVVIINVSEQGTGLETTT
jgi:hypothetical protein